MLYTIPVSSFIKRTFNTSDINLLASASHDETIRLWNVETGECIQTLPSEKPYAGINIAGIKGLTEAEIATLKILGAVEAWN